MEKPKTTPKDFFFYVAAMITLYISAGSLLALLFSIVNASFPDVLSYSDPYSSGMRFAIAFLIIIFPIYIVLSWLLRKDIVKNPEKKELSIRKWLIYLTLFVAGAAVTGDLIALLNTFLGGELTSRFVYKVLSVLFVAGLIFAYYLYDLRRSADENKKVSIGLVIGACLVVLISLISGFSIIGSPESARIAKFDENRVNHLSDIQWQLVNYWQQKGVLPNSLSELKDSISGYSAPTDPKTKESYEYEKTGATTFNLCATFESESGVNNESESGINNSKPRVIYRGDMGAWEHGIGRTCFEKTIDKDLYPVRPKDL